MYIYIYIYIGAKNKNINKLIVTKNQNGKSMFCSFIDRVGRQIINK